MLRVCCILLFINLGYQLHGIIETFGIQWLSKVKVLLLTSAGLWMVASICVIPQVKRAYEKRGKAEGEAKRELPLTPLLIAFIVVINILILILQTEGDGNADADQGGASDSPNIFAVAASCKLHRHCTVSNFAKLSAIPQMWTRCATHCARSRRRLTPPHSA